MPSRIGVGFLSCMATRILIVDDHEVVRMGIRLLFSNNGPLQVCGEAEDGPDALRKVLELSPDVVILDLTMPGMNGFETAARMRQIAPSVKIIFYSIHEIPATARISGGDAFISKASASQELIMTVNRVMQSGGGEKLN
jgi:DNA-binding NarL/FixJ family response regulator